MPRREQLHLALEGGELRTLVARKTDIEDRAVLIVDVVAGVGFCGVSGNPSFERVDRLFQELVAEFQSALVGGAKWLAVLHR